MKRRLLILLAALLLLAATAISWLLFTESGLNMAYQSARKFIPGELSIDTLQGSLAGTISAKQIDYAIKGHRISIRDTQLDWDLAALLGARLDIRQLRGRQLAVHIDHGDRKKEQEKETSVRILPLGISVGDAQVQDISITYKDSEVRLDEVRLQGHSLLQNLTIDRLLVKAEQFSVDIGARLRFRGRKKDYRIEMTGQGSGHYQPLGPLQGSFELALLQDNSFDITRLSVLSPDSASDLDVHGSWKPGAKGGAIDLALNWRRLRWPAGDNPWFDSSGGTAWILGYIEDYQFGISTRNPWSWWFPASHWHASARGDLQGMAFHSLRVETLNGDINAQGRIGWQSGFTWQARASAENLDPQRQWQGWPGRLSAQVSSSGGVRDGRLHGKAELSRLRGKVRDYPVSGDAVISWIDSDFQLQRLNLESGSTSASIRGDFGKALNLQWQLQAGNLAELDGRIQGRLSARGRLRGTSTAPLLELHARSERLGSSGYHAEDLVLDTTLDLPAVGQLELEMTAKNLDLGGTQVPGVKLTATGSDNNYGLRLAATLADGDGLFTMDLDRNRDRWSGRITGADLRLKDQAPWHLREETRLIWNDHQGQLEPLCLDSGEAQICVGASHEQQLTDIQFNARELPLALLSPWLPRDLSLDGRTNASANLQHGADSGLRGRAELILPAARLHYPPLQNRDQPWSYEQIRSELILDADGIRFSGKAMMDEFDQMSFSASLPAARLPGLDRDTQPVQGEMHLQVRKLQHLEGLFPDLQAIRGHAEASVDIEGTLARPRLGIRVRLDDGSFQVPRLGLKITELKLEAGSLEDNRLEYRINARSGKGHILIHGNTLLDPKQGWQTSIGIKGEEFEVASIPEARIRATPDLNLQIRGRNINIGGEIYIPFARLRPRDITTSVGTSSDVVIVGDAAEREEKWHITSAVRLGFGEQVHFDGFGFEGNFYGAVLVTEEPGQPTRATGQVHIPEGRYHAYGQRLNVDRGRLLYTGGPLDNPGMDIQATRKVQEVTAGLKVRGTLHNPKVELFSIPAMSQIDALSYLLLGRRLEGATEDEGAMMARAALALGLKGGDLMARDIGERFGLDDMRIESADTGDNASLVIGRYLSPRLYISYGVGLIESVNTFTIRYQISDKWQFKAQSGASQGADLLYTIER